MYTSIRSWALLSALVIFIVLGTSLPSMLLWIVISGSIPGTSYILPLWFVMSVYPIIAVSVLVWIIGHTIYIGEDKNSAPSKHSQKKTTQKTMVSTKNQLAVKRRHRTAV